MQSALAELTGYSIPADADARAAFLAAEQLRREMDWVRAIEKYTESVELDPGSPAALPGLIDALVSQGSTNAARMELVRMERLGLVPEIYAISGLIVRRRFSPLLFEACTVTLGLQTFLFGRPRRACLDPFLRSFASLLYEFGKTDAGLFPVAMLASVFGRLNRDDAGAARAVAGQLQQAGLYRRRQEFGCRYVESQLHAGFGPVDVLATWSAGTDETLIEFVFGRKKFHA